MVLPVLVFAAVVAPSPQETPPPPLPTAEAAPAPEARATHSAAADEAIQAGLVAFKARRFAAAQNAFERALAADPNDAAATWYLAYTIYKIAEPKRPFHPDKQKAAALFAKAYELDPTFRPVWSMR